MMLPSPPEPVVAFGDSSSGAYLAGRAAQSHHDLAQARAYLDRALAEDPEMVEILYRAAIADVLDGHFEQAVTLAARLEVFDQESSLPAMLLAEQRAKQGDWAGALVLFEHLPPRGLDNTLLPLGRAWAKMGEDKIDAALEQLAPLQSANGTGTLFHYNVGLINDLADRHGAAEQAYRATLSANGGHSLRNVTVVANFLRRIGRESDAAALVGEFLHDHPDLPPFGVDGPRVVATAQDGFAEAFFGAAGTLRQTNMPDLALFFVKLTLDLRPDFPQAQLMEGDILSALDQHEAANAAYAALPSVWRVPTSLRIARNLEEVGRIDQAAALLTDLDRTIPQSADGPLALGDLWRRQKRWRDAVQAYDRALARLPPDRSNQWSVYYARGIALERANQWPRAEADLLHALELQPNEPELLNYLGYSWVEQGTNLPRATTMIERAVSLRPTDGFIIDSLGWAFYRSGEFSRAVETLQRAVTLVPGDAAINDHLGDALWRDGRREEALFQWQHALQSDPDPDLRVLLTQKIQAGGLTP